MEPLSDSDAMEMAWGPSVPCEDQEPQPEHYTRDELREVLRQVRPADLHWLKLEGIGQEQRARLGIVPTPKAKVEMQ